jgi:hypothetical protein
MPASREDWERVGPQLAARRAQISARYASRRAFADDAGLNWRLLYDAERGRRATFKTETVRALETAYRLVPGSLDGTLAGGPLKPLPAPAEVTAPVPPPRPAGQDGPPVSEEFFTEHVLPAQDPYDRQVIEAVLRLTDGEGRLLPWPARWEYIEVTLGLRHGRQGRDAGLIPHARESELVLN